jgi:HlyD family secretion protein
MSFSRQCLYLLMSFACLASMVGCQSKAQEPASTAVTATPSVPIVHPTRQTLTRLVQQPGWIRSYEQTPIYSKIAGFVEHVYVDIDSRVKKGDLLLKMWVPEMEEDYNAKKARVSKAEADVKQAEHGLIASGANVNTAEALIAEAVAGVEKSTQDYERWEKEVVRGEKFVKERIYDQQTLDEAMNQMRQAKAGIAQALARVNSTKAGLAESKAKYLKAQADVESAKANFQVAVADRDQSLAWLNYREIRAPYDGVVTARNVHTGAFLQSSSSGSTNLNADPLFVMVRMELMRINVQVPEYDAVLVKKGMPAIVRFPGTTIPDHLGKVTIFTWSVDEMARTLRAEIHLPNPQEMLRPGLFVNAVITVQLPDTLVLPSESLMNEGDNYYCYVIQEGKAVRTAVQVGVKSDKLTQVLRKQERHVGDPKSDKWDEFTGREDVVARNPTSLIDGQALAASTQGQ